MWTYFLSCELSVMFFMIHSSERLHSVSKYGMCNTYSGGSKEYADPDNDGCSSPAVTSSVPTNM